MNRIPTLDGWRGVAILLVLIDHAIWGITGANPLGRVSQHGVAIFFVLSGYLITSRFCEEFDRTGKLDLGRFYARRFFRLMPAAWLYLAIVGVVLLSQGFFYTRRELLGSLLFFRNFIYNEGTSLTGHFWSLSLEEQFYLTWPAVLLFAGFKRARWIAGAAIVLLVAYRFSQRDTLLALPLWATFRTQFRADGLLIGCLAALLLPGLSRRFQPWMIWPLLLAFGFCLHRYDQIIPAGESLIIALLLHATTLFPQTIAARLLSWRALTFLGAISYSLYLWQQLFLLTRVTHPLDSLVPIALLFAIAILSHFYLELPLIRLGKNLSPSRASRCSSPRSSYSATSPHRRTSRSSSPAIGEPPAR
ncbi:MAG TPA: acyltransferase [Acidisarcina sp.]|nr:acyltransferase [Acidisarcina sp.]